MNSPLDPLIGREIDSYLIDKLLGAGGMARVYRGHDVRLERYVAIKVIEPEARQDPEYAMRFEKEARAVAQLQHPHIVSIYRFGEIGGLYYMAMQFIDGADLDWVLTDYALDQELMPHEDVLRIVSQIGAALDHAHSKGVIHRDVKPSNVMLDKEGRAILADFGLVLLQAEGTRGEIFGTPHYLAPEQAVNSAGAVPQSDQYSLGVILYEMLTGSRPYDGTSPMDIAMAHMAEPLPPPLERNPDLHPAFVTILEKVLQKEPPDRYLSCAALVTDLEQAVSAQKHKASTASRRFSLIGTSEQVAAFRNANPLPPLPAAVAQSPAPTRSSPAATPTKTAAHKKSPTTVKRPARQRQSWVAAAAASVVVIIIGVVAISALLAPRAAQPTETPAPTALVGSAQTLPTEAQPQSSPPLPTPPAAASEGTITYLLIISTRGEDSLFLLNPTVQPFPLGPLRVGDGNGAINGSEWGIDRLDHAACVTVWKDSGNPQAPDVTCSQVGIRLVRSGPDRFWNSPFNVYYNGVQVGTCSSESCAITITV